MMSCHIEPDGAAAVAPLRILSWREICRRGAVAWLRACWQRRRERRELCVLIATDYRAAADIGVTFDEAVSWSRRPFWRA
jgi:uncharacterized protein YjiS (DUF1127 family)